MWDYTAYEQFVALCEQEARGSGSALKRMMTYIPDKREEAEQRLINDYFSNDETRPKYPEENFRRRQRYDAVGHKSIGPILKCTSVIRQLAYDTALDAFDEYLQITEQVNMRDMFVSPEANIQRTWIEGCDFHVRKTKELRDRKVHNDLRHDLVEHL
nr:hypothetical protein [Tanacetum cinerariifolium]